MASVTIIELGVITSIIGIVMGAIAFGFKKWLDDKFVNITTDFAMVDSRLGKIESKQEETDKGMLDMERNYKHEFSDVKENAHTVKEEILKQSTSDKQEILDKINTITVSLTEIKSAVEQQKDFCKGIQQDKKFNGKP